MKIEIKDDGLISILTQRADIFNKVKKVNEEIMDKDKERTKLGYQMDKLKEKTKKIIDKMNPQLAEFEIISNVFLENGKAYYEVVNQVEEYKKMYRENTKKK